MENARFKAMLNMSSDHVGIKRELGRLQREMYRVIARIDTARHVRDYLIRLQGASAMWLRENPHFAPWDRNK